MVHRAPVACFCNLLINKQIMTWDSVDGLLVLGLPYG
jgi:hypothetical protein